MPRCECAQISLAESGKLRVARRAYAKARLGKPVVNTTMSLVSLVFSVIVCKEGAYHVGVFDAGRIAQTLILILVGATVSNVVCLAIWRTSATSRLQAETNRTLSSFATLLELLTKNFLLLETTSAADGGGVGARMRPETLKRAIENHQSSFTRLRAIYEQARYEVFDPRMRGSRKEYDELVTSMTRLAQGLNMMRSGCSLQHEIMLRRAARAEADAEKLKAAKASGIVVDGGLVEDTEELPEDEKVFEEFKGQIGESLIHLTVRHRPALHHWPPTDGKMYFLPHRRHARTRSRSCARLSCAHVLGPARATPSSSRTPPRTTQKLRPRF